MSRPESRGSRRPLLTAPLRRSSVYYPFPDLAPAFKQIIVQALRSAWERLLEQMSRDGGVLCAETEPAITSRLEVALNAIQEEPGHPSGFSGSLFQNVIRGAEIPNYNEEKLEKRPDLTFRLISPEPGIERFLYALFVECKIVGPSHPIRTYCDDGILRFVSGDYAWAMPCGMMVAYSHQGFTVAEHLLPYLLRTRPGTGKLETRLPPRASALTGNPPVYESDHERTWVYPDEGRGPGNITILHLWLPLP